MVDEQKELIGRLVKAYRGSSTESLIGRITGTDGMLEACRKLLNERDTGSADLQAWLRHRCEQTAIDEHAFLQEVRTIIELFSPHSDDEDPYQVLGLTSEAGPEQIKRAYRKLSLQYHPDTAPEQNRTDPDQFIKITRAYQTLLGNYTELLQPIKQRTTNNNTWRQKKQPNRHSPQRKKVFIWTLSLLTLLLIVSFIAATNYRKKTMIAGLQHSRGAFIPPPAKTVAAAAPQTSTQINIEQQTPKQGPSTKIQQAPVIDKDTKLLTSAIPHEKPVPNQKKIESFIESSPKTEATIEQFPSSQEVAKKPEITHESKETQQLENEVPSITAKPVKVTEASSPEETKKQSSQTEDTEISAAQRPDSSPGAASIAKSKGLSSQLPTEMQLTAQDGASVDASSIVPEDAPDDLLASASAKAETSAEEDNSEETYVVPLEQRLRSFFDSYLEAYNERNILTFSRFFAVDAIENGKPFATMVQTYLELFQKTDSAILEITDLDWNKTSDQIEATGRFNVNLHYDDGHQVSGTGPITFQLLENGNSFQISRLKYHFEH